MSSKTNATVTVRKLNATPPRSLSNGGREYSSPDSSAETCCNVIRTGSMETELDPYLETSIGGALSRSSESGPSAPCEEFHVEQSHSLDGGTELEPSQVHQNYTGLRHATCAICARTVNNCSRDGAGIQPRESINAPSTRLLQPINTGLDSMSLMFAFEQKQRAR